MQGADAGGQGVFIVQEMLERVKKGCHPIPTQDSTIMWPPVGIPTQQTQAADRILMAQHAREVILEVMEYWGTRKAF
ncbi:MAG: hypothetical protein ABJX82_00190 [Paracoccaceae bacterium]